LPSASGSHRSPRRYCRSTFTGGSLRLVMASARQPDRMSRLPTRATRRPKTAPSSTVSDAGMSMLATVTRNASPRRMNVIRVTAQASTPSPAVIRSSHGRCPHRRTRIVPFQGRTALVIFRTTELIVPPIELHSNCGQLITKTPADARSPARSLVLSRITSASVVLAPYYPSHPGNHV